MALYELYADESESGNFITVAAFIYTKNHAREMQEEWQPILARAGLPYFRMSDCAHGNGVFATMRDDVERRSEIQIKLFEILKKYKSVGFAVSFDQRLSHLLPSSLNLEIDQITPYTLCAYWLMVNARNWVDRRLPDAKISYFYEAGHKDESQAFKLMTALNNSEWHRNHYKIASLSFVNKEHSAAIQTGDILSWQWCKYKKDIDNRRFNPRKDLVALIDDEQTFTTHFDEQRVTEFLDIVSLSRGTVQA